jgi:hypothetical protein
MDSWFVTDFMLKSIREIKGGLLHATGICKMDKRKFEVNGKLYNSQTIITMNENKRGRLHACRKFKSKYMTLVATYSGTPVKLFYIKYKNANRWTLLLTADLSLSFVKAMELYQIRWSIEVMFNPHCNSPDYKMLQISQVHFLKFRFVHYKFSVCNG